DLALLHDLSGLAAAARLGLHLIAVCVDNDGGEIFSLLPVADRIPSRDFERLFRTPHGVDLCGLDGFAGIRAARVSTSTGLVDAVGAAASTRAPGVDLLVVDIDRDDDVAQRRALTAAAQQAARQALAAVQGRD
ncbi:MAG: 2-succinyl-5-enolpyruvyl-6-hydroxy-3-cyclohexene-1-carboxylic-acid synthase, partial [bacterium]|nr:2-succinyl-5-enolpyruvyl-6-hydroxy-3-cyclohexene-1-carboxylic-acid synthase [bacterium]